MCFFFFVLFSLFFCFICILHNVFVFFFWGGGIVSFYISYCRYQHDTDVQLDADFLFFFLSPVSCCMPGWSLSRWSNSTNGKRLQALPWRFARSCGVEQLKQQLQGEITCHPGLFCSLFFMESGDFWCPVV